MKVATARIDSKSRNVRAYVKAMLKARKLDGDVARRAALLRPYYQRAAKARTAATALRAKLNGTQMAESERLLSTLLAVDAAVAETLATPCRPTERLAEGGAAKEGAQKPYPGGMVAGSQVPKFNRENLQYVAEANRRHDAAEGGQGREGSRAYPA